MDNDRSNEIADAIRSISHGDKHGPTGLEMLSMSISGDGNGSPLSEAVSEGLRDIAEAIREGLAAIAEAQQNTNR